MDLFSRMFAVVKTCLELPPHRRFVGFKIDANCLVACTESHVQRYTRKILNGKSCISAMDDLVHACKTVVRVVDGL